MRLPGTSEGEVRLGVAIAIPEPFARALQAARDSFGDPLARLIPPHVTLLGPTVRASSALEEVEAHLEAVAARHEPFTMHLRGTGTFRPVSPVVFVQVAHGIAACERLEADIRSGVLDEHREFNYHPHVTVAHELEDPALDEAFSSLERFEASFVVDSFSLFDHGEDGLWRPAREFRLG
ncbi:MAG: 2'-5' RNA ligase family protein [Actinomycetota bacterium]|nr:2'-5' RNA ligase family protein [Actinomycetota bacterium]